jgi:hypothetical protein
VPANTASVGQVVAVLSAIEELRQEAAQVQSAYLERLAALMHLVLPANASPPAAFDKWTTRIARFVVALGRLPMFARQTWLMSRRRTGRDSTRTVVMALATNRISFQGRGGVRQGLSALVRPLGKQRNDDVGGKLRAAGRVVIFDPLPVSALWARRRECWRDEVFIVDATFLWFSIATSIVRRPLTEARALSRIVQLSKREAGNARFSWVPITIGAVVIRGYGALLDREPWRSSVEAIFLTANSRLTELLRAYLMNWDGCTAIEEIMHGVGSVPARRTEAGVHSSNSEPAGLWSIHKPAAVPRFRRHQPVPESVFSRQDR